MDPLSIIRRQTIARPALPKNGHGQAIATKNTGENHGPSGIIVGLWEKKYGFLFSNQAAGLGTMATGLRVGRAFVNFLRCVKEWLRHP